MNKLSASDRWNRPLAVFGVMLCIVLCAGCTPSVEPAAGATDTGSQAVEVVTIHAAVEGRAVAIEAVGTARANESVEVTAKTVNSVRTIRFHEGAPVRRGEVLIELDDLEQQAAVREAEALVAESETQYARSQTLSSQHVLSVSQLEQIEVALKTNRARLDAARARLADTVIRAGFDGQTGLRRLSVGSLVSPGTVITTLDDVSKIKVEFSVPETYLYLLEKGLSITASTPGLPGRLFKGSVSALDSRVDTTTRSVALRAEIPNPDGSLRPGMFMTINLTTALAPTVLVPESAVIPEQGNVFVLVVVDDIVQRKQVRTGRRWPGEVELLSGIDPGERVITQGVQNVRTGTQVRERALRAAGSDATGG